MRIAILLNLILHFTIANAQKESKMNDLNFSRFAIGISPSAFLNLKPGIQISLESRIKKNINTRLEVGYLFNEVDIVNIGIDQPIDKHENGIRIRTSIEKKIYGNEKSLTALGLFVNYYHFTKLVDRRISRSDEQYFEHYRYKEKLNKIGIGVQISDIYKLSDRFYMRYGVGLGYGIPRISTQNLGDNRLPIPTDEGESGLGIDRLSLILLLNLNFGYAIF